MNIRLHIGILILSCAVAPLAHAQGTGPTADDVANTYTVFDDKLLLEGYAEKFQEDSKETLLAVLQDEDLTAYKQAAAVRVFRQKFGKEVVSREKRQIEKTLIRRLNRTDSAFVQVEVFHTLVILDRYKYFNSMVPALLQKLEHHNAAVVEQTFHALTDITENGTYRSREARIIFNTIRRMLFLQRNHLISITQPEAKLRMKLHLLRGAIKVLGTQELQRLPKEVINLL